jgi:hypothetical protein
MQAARQARPAVVKKAAPPELGPCRWMFLPFREATVVARLVNKGRLRGRRAKRAQQSRQRVSIVSAKAVSTVSYLAADFSLFAGRGSEQPDMQ